MHKQPSNVDTLRQEIIDVLHQEGRVSAHVVCDKLSKRHVEVHSALYRLMEDGYVIRHRDSTYELADVVLPQVRELVQYGNVGFVGSLGLVPDRLSTSWVSSLWPSELRAHVPYIVRRLVLDGEADVRPLASAKDYFERDSVLFSCEPVISHERRT